VVAELEMSNEELEYDIVKEVVQNGSGKPSENKEDHHHVHKDRADLLKLRHIIQVQEDSIRELEREIIELKKLVHDKRISETSNDMAPSPTATPAAAIAKEVTPAVATPAAAATSTTTTPAAATAEAVTPSVATPAATSATATPAATGNPAPSTRTRTKTVVKRKFVKSSKLVHPFTTYPKKRRRSARIGARVVKSRKN